MHPHLRHPGNALARLTCQLHATADITPHRIENL